MKRRAQQAFASQSDRQRPSTVGRRPLARTGAGQRGLSFHSCCSPRPAATPAKMAADHSMGDSWKAQPSPPRGPICPARSLALGASAERGRWRARAAARCHRPARPRPARRRALLRRPHLRRDRPGLLALARATDAPPASRPLTLRGMAAGPGCARAEARRPRRAHVLDALVGGPTCRLASRDARPRTVDRRRADPARSAAKP
jgi:hypothetical protein